MVVDKPKKEQILDAAEQLFAEKGFHGVSVRDITEAAGVRLASVNYYFETKDNLYYQLLVRRGSHIFSERVRRLNHIDFDSLDDREAVAQICHAIVDPLVEKVRTNDPGWKAFSRVVANLMASPLAMTKKVPSKDEFDLLSLDMVKALQRYAVNNDEQKAHHAFQFISSASFTLFSNNKRLNELSQGKYRTDDYDRIYENAMAFLVGAATNLLLGSHQ